MIYLRNNKTLQQLTDAGVDENYHAILQYLSKHDTPLDILLAAEFAQIQTFGIPSISKILRQTRQYQDQGLKRLDDTRAIMIEALEDTVHSERGRHMVNHLNWIHGHYPIKNDDYLFTLALFIIEPARWMENWGYRQRTQAEKDASFLEFRDLGNAMNIENIPENYDAFVQWYESYRSQNMAFHPDNTIVTEGLIEGMQKMFPAIVSPLIKPLILTLLNDDILLNAVGMKKPPRWQRIFIIAIMKIRAQLMKVFNPWHKKPFTDSQLHQRFASYPGGYQNQCLGPQKLLQHTTPETGCPFR
ncbi:Uncharacterised protein [BD1-7 clade bacterium]|uniref:ER-bound oxygenase mpaB/mpaB'/Rubber oxygenase catalytic domain-containing protein n=1 Tax=BD1-7 clade bacterium TaxID=2029982 RepID=A0A5S9PI47_9GAMM|nr:Uncharacterised protein [BD1-7 clade bacterium]CAA0103721.1 Uncharacterised protein [BD1-7 clade bacterium]